MTAKVYDFETELSKRLTPVRFATAATTEDGKVIIDAGGTYSPSVARSIARAILTMLIRLSPMAS